MEEVEEVGNGPGEGDEDAEAHVNLHAGRTANDMMFWQAIPNYHALAVNLHNPGQNKLVEVDLDINFFFFNFFFFFKF